MVGSNHSLKILAPQLSWFWIGSVLKILNKRTQLFIYLFSDKGVYRTAPATPGLLIIQFVFVTVFAECALDTYMGLD